MTLLILLSCLYGSEWGALTAIGALALLSCLYGSESES